MKKLFFALIPALLIAAACQKETREVIPTAASFSADAKSTSVKAYVRSTCDYTVEINPPVDWLKEVSHDSKQIDFSLTQNTSDDDRTANVDLCYGDAVLASFQIVQGAPDPELIYPAPENKSFIRLAYFPSYRKTDAVNMPDDFLKTVDVACFAFASINDDYVVKLQSGVSTLGALVDRCHKLGVKVVISFAGSWLDKRYVTMSQSASLRKKFIQSVMDIVNEYGLDGVDNDWEFPSSTDGSQKGNLLLMRQLSNILHAPGVNKLLTQAINCAVYKGSYTNGLDSGVFDCCDWFGSMVYDDYSTSVAGKNHSTYEIMVNSYDYWVGTRGMPASKFVGGIPAYGRASGITQTGTALSYSSILSQGGDPDKDEAVVTSSSYSGGAYTIYYNGRPTVRRKVEFLMEKNAGGYFFWEAGQDVTDERSLLRTAAATAAGQAE